MMADGRQRVNDRVKNPTIAQVAAIFFATMAFTTLPAPASDHIPARRRTINSTLAAIAKRERSRKMEPGLWE
jgi:hypothetical protein